MNKELVCLINAAPDFGGKFLAWVYPDCSSAYIYCKNDEMLKRNIQYALGTGAREYTITTERGVELKYWSKDAK